MRKNGFLTVYTLWVGLIMVFLASSTCLLSVQFLKQIPYRRQCVQMDYDVQAVLRDCVEEMQGQSMAKKREFLQAPMRRCQALHPEYEVQGEEMHYDPIFFGYPTPGYVSVRIHDTKRHIWCWGSLKVQTQKEADGSYKTIILHGVRD